jgi:hypothetical protein
MLCNRQHIIDHPNAIQLEGADLYCSSSRTCLVELLQNLDLFDVDRDQHGPIKQAKSVAAVKCGKWRLTVLSLRAR